MSLSNEPALKVFLKHCRDLIDSNNSERHRTWTLVCEKKSISLHLVWIQGTIVNVLESQGVITLDDGTSTADISVKDAPGFGPWIKIGEYVMVIGEVLSVRPDVKIKALKLTHLVRPDDEMSWILETLDFWRFLDPTKPLAREGPGRAMPEPE